MPKTFRVSDESINSYRCRVLSEGGNTKAFESNPVMLHMHLRGNVIGKWVNLRQENGEWFADPVFDMADTRQGGGADIGGKVDREFINAASMGVIVHECTYNELLDCYDVTKWSLQEISIVDIGSNQNTLQLYDQAGEPISELKMASFLETFKPAPKESQSISTPNLMFELKTLSLAFGLPESASEQEVLTMAAKGKAAIDELATLKLTAEQNRKNEAETLVQTAINEMRIPATSKDLYLKLFAGDHESAKTVLAGMPKPQNLNLFTQNGQQTQTTETESLSSQYDALDKADKLMTLKAENPDQFKALYKAKFGTDPNKVFA